MVSSDRLVVELGFRFLGSGRRFLRRRGMPPRKGRVGERELTGDLGVFTVVSAEGGGSSLGCAPTEIIAVVSHARVLLPIVNV